MQQRQPGGHAVLGLGNVQHRPAVAAAGHRDLPLVRRAVLAAAQLRVGDGARLDAERRTAAVGLPDRDLWAAGRRHLALDAVTRPAGHFGHRRVERRQRAQGRVRQPIPRRARIERRCHEHRIKQRLIGTRDADGDGLGLMLDGVHRPGQLVDGEVQRIGEVVDDHRGQPYFADVGLVHLQRRHAGGVPQHRAEASGGAGPQVPVVAARTHAVAETVGRRPQAFGQHSEQVAVLAPGCRRADAGFGREHGFAVSVRHALRVIGASAREQRFGAGSHLPERLGQRVDGQRRLVAEQVARSGGQHEVERRMHSGHLEQLGCRVEASGAGGGDHDRRSAMRAVDGHLFGGVVGHRAGQPRGAHPDQRFAREVDVLLVLSSVFGHRVVADLGELDADLPRRNPVRTVAHHCPVAMRSHVTAGDASDLAVGRQHGLER